jgi:hypothetical protein
VACRAKYKSDNAFKEGSAVLSSWNKLLSVCIWITPCNTPPLEQCVLHQSFALNMPMMVYGEMVE